MTKLTELRDALDYMKEQSGTGSKSRKQQKFREIYSPNVAALIAGERYDDAGIGPATAREAVSNVFPSVALDEYDTLSAALIDVETSEKAHDSCHGLVTSLDQLAELSGDEQASYLVEILRSVEEPSLVTLALLDDETFGLGTSQMREAFVPTLSRSERKHAESFVDSTRRFISLAEKGKLPDGPTVGEPFAPMLAVPESRGTPENPVAQEKIDGYRILIHISENNGIRAFSRRNNEVTDSLPELQEIDFPDGDYILDGEVIAESGSYSDTSSRIGRDAENVERDVEMHFKLFDILVNDGREVWEMPFHERLVQLIPLVELDIDDVRVDYLEIDGNIEKAKDGAIEAGDEGIIVKDLQSPYEFGKRSAYWQKQKLDAESVDVVITGFNEGTGETSGTLGAVEIESADGVPLGNSGSGFSEAQRDKIWNNKEKYLNRVIEIEGRGIVSQGKVRMPIFKRARFDDGEADPYDRICEIMKEI